MLKTELQTAKAILATQGWTFLLSTTGNKSTGEYGLLYTKNGVKFWLNNLTISTVLTQ